MPLFRKTKYSTVRSVPKKDIPKGLWLKCTGCEGTISRSSLGQDLNVCTTCGFHYPLPADVRIALLTDEDSSREADASLRAELSLLLEHFSGASRCVGSADRV